MKQRQLSPRSTAIQLSQTTNIKKGSKVVVLGSNYLMFRRYKEDPHCPKCADSFEPIDPTHVDVFTFEVSLAVRELLLKKGIPTSVLIMPSDFMKGATSDQLTAFRESYVLPESFQKLLREYGVPEEDQIFRFESTFKARAQNILRKRVLRDKSVGTIQINDVLIARPSEISPLDFPIARMVELPDGNILPIPFCQMICSAIYERISNMGFTHFFGMFNSSEVPCIYQGTALAHILGYLRMKTQISVFREKDHPLDDKWARGQLIKYDVAHFDPSTGKLPYPYSELTE